MEVVLRFNAKGHGATDDPTEIIYVVRSTDKEELLVWDRVPHEALGDGIAPGSFFDGILRSAARKSQLWPESRL